jgi:hypothetical protein
MGACADTITEVVQEMKCMKYLPVNDVDEGAIEAKFLWELELEDGALL